MASYSDMANDQRQAQWLKRWVPETEEEYTTEHCLDIDWGQYRFTLARARDAESQLADIQRVLGGLHKIMKGIHGI